MPSTGRNFSPNFVPQDLSSIQQSLSSSSSMQFPYLPGTVPTISHFQPSPYYYSNPFHVAQATEGSAWYVHPPTYAPLPEPVDSNLFGTMPREPSHPVSNSEQEILKIMAMLMATEELVFSSALSLPKTISTPRNPNSEYIFHRNNYRYQVARMGVPLDIDEWSNIKEKMIQRLKARIEEGEIIYYYCECDRCKKSNHPMFSLKACDIFGHIMDLEHIIIKCYECGIEIKKQNKMHECTRIQ